MDADLRELEARLTAPDAHFAWEVADVLGVPTRVWKHAPPSVLALWEASRAHGDAEYLVYRGERWTFAQAHAAVDALAAELASRWGVGKGDRVAVAARNYPEWALAFWAGVALGAVVVPLNAWWSGPELAFGLEQSGSKVLIADGERVERVLAHGASPALAGIVAIRSRELPEGVAAFDELLDAGSGRTPDPVDVDPDDDVTILYTSGTTGEPKGAAGTHRNICSFLMNGMYAAALRAELARLTPASRDGGAAPRMATLLTFPLFHVGGLQSHLIPYTFYGGTLVLMYRWDPDEAVDLIEDEEVTAFSGVPTTVFQLLERATERGRTLPSLGGISSGATLVPPELVRRIDSQFLSRVSPGNGYGLTETSGAMTANAGAQYLERPDSVGRVIAPVNEIRILGEDGGDVPAGELGEICFKGPTVVRGYFRNPEATAQAFTDGWFHTGDLGCVDPDGWVYVVDRLKDVVIRGGENVYAAEVENALYEHPDVAEAAIFGLPHPTLGEEVGAVVRLQEAASAETEDLRRHLEARLASFKVPSRFFFWPDELPRNAAGKVLKRQLRRQLTEARVDEGA